MLLDSLSDPECIPEAGKGNGILLRHPELNPSRPLTVSFWFRLGTPMLPESGFHLATLRGNPGIVSTFVRGKGQWCALREPTRVLQVYYFAGIPNHNGLLGSAEFAPGVWHHACLVIARGETVRWTINGVEVGNHTIRGRPFRQNDGGTLDIGPNWLAHPLSVDEILVLDVALESSEVTANFFYEANKDDWKRHWSIEIYERYQIQEQMFQEQQYTILKDLHCWTGEVTCRVKKESDFTFWVIFRLKEFPDLPFFFRTTYRGPEPGKRTRGKYGLSAGI